jgi:hypothetical protein
MWCGWRVRTYELMGTPFDPPRDLMQPAVRSQAEEDIAIADASLWGIPCRTFSKARDIPVTTGRVRPLPLRSDSHLRGLPRLSEPGAETDREKVSNDNELADWSIEQEKQSAQRGDAVMSEHPATSYLHKFPAKLALRDLGVQPWMYDNCCFEGTRLKHQRLDTNIEEILEEQAKCDHVHKPAAAEWALTRTAKGGTQFRTQEECEYTAAFVYFIAVRLSAWAVKTGRGSLKLERFSSPALRQAIRPVRTGDRREWVDLDPTVVRSRAMPGMALRMRLEWPKEHQLYEDLPSLVWKGDRGPAPLQAHEVYIGYGDHRARWSRSDLVPPVWPPRHVERVQRLREYANALQNPEHPHRRALQKIAHRKPPVTCLVVDEEPLQVSPAEAAAEVIWYERLNRLAATPSKGSRKQSSRTLTAGLRALMPFLALGTLMPRPVVGQGWAWSDAEIHGWIRKLYPPEWLHGVCLPVLEDICNSPEFSSWRRHVREHDMEHRCLDHFSAATGWISLALRRQRGATGHKHALAPTVGFGQGWAEHYRMACSCVDLQEDPWSIEATADPDYEYAAEQIVLSVADLEHKRKTMRGMLKELSNRTQELSTALRKHQRPSVHMVAGKVQLGFMTLTTLLALWRDTRQCLRFCSGFQSINKLEYTDLWTRTDSPAATPVADLVATYESNLKRLQNAPMDEEASFLWESCMKEVSKQKCKPPVRPRDMCRLHNGVASAIPCFCHTQASGKQRRIDDGKKSGNNLGTQYSEKFCLPNAFTPAMAVQAFWRAAIRVGASPRVFDLIVRLESATEDMPDAFRTIPVLPEHLPFNHVMARHPDTGAVWCFPMLAALFGNGSSVYAYARLSCFLEAIPRRLLHLLWTMYVDDGQLTEPTSGQKEAQELIHEFFEYMGMPLAPDKSKPLDPCGEFLGISHDLSYMPQHGYVEFWPKETLVEKVEGLLDSIESQRRCTPAEASKLRGTLGFTAMAQYGHVGRSYLSPFKQRQYTDVPPWHPSDTMMRAIEFARVLIKERPCRRIPCGLQRQKTILVASDAQVEPGTLPGGGVLLYDSQNGLRWGGWIQFTDRNLSTWDLSMQLIQDGSQPIALCEAAMIPLTMMEWPREMRGRSILWYIDNTSAMASFLKGASRNPHLEKIVGLTWIVACHLQVELWFEWVDSEANWSDSISRKLSDDPVAKQLGFTTAAMHPDLTWWAADWNEIWQRTKALCHPITRGRRSSVGSESAPS